MPRIILHPIEDPATNTEYPGSYALGSGVSAWPPGVEPPILGDDAPDAEAGQARWYQFDGSGDDFAEFLLPQLEVEPAKVTAIGFRSRGYTPFESGQLGLDMVVSGYDTSLGNFSIEHGEVPGPFGPIKCIDFSEVPGDPDGIGSVIDEPISAENYANFVFGGSEMSMLRLAEYLADPGRATMRLRTVPADGTSSGLVLSEAWLWVEYGAPRLRKHPIASTRKWPRENWAGSSLRKVGSYQ